MSTPTTDPERDEPDAQEWEDLPDGQEPLEAPDQEWAPLPIPDTEGEPC